MFTVVGTVANGTAESGNAFFNTIYIQDEEGNGINVFPIDDSNIRRGDQVQVTGSVSEYIGDKQLSAINVTVLEGSKEVVITDTTTKEANDYAVNFGKLVRVKGEVTKVTMAGGIVESITVQDDSGEACRVFIDGYIGYSDDTSQALEEFVEEGAYISAVGFVPVIYVVNVSIQNGSFEGAKTAVEGQAYTGKIVAAEGYKLPAEITVKVSGEELSAGGFLRSADYTYDAKTGEITINADAVTGAIEISAVCEADQGQGGSGSQGGQSGSQTGGDDQQGGDKGSGNGGSGSDEPAKTGDDTSVMPWIALMAAAVLAAGAAGVVVVRRRRR